MIRLGDDGTMDTVLVCSECGKEMRYIYDPSADFEVNSDPNDSEPSEQNLKAAYDAWLEWVIEDATDSHVCGEDS